MEGVHPALIKCAERALSISKYDMTIPWMGGVRTAEDQRKIFDQGYSQVDGYKKKSYHQTGKALDVIPVKGGYDNDKAFRHFAKCMFLTWQRMMTRKETEGYFLEWGGHWMNFIDNPHWQLVN